MIKRNAKIEDIYSFKMVLKLQTHEIEKFKRPISISAALFSEQSACLVCVLTYNSACALGLFDSHGPKQL